MLNIALLHWRTSFTSAANICCTVALTVWLAVFGPMLCQYHGLMWNHHHPTALDELDTALPSPKLETAEMMGMSPEEHAKHHHHVSEQQPSVPGDVSPAAATVPSALPSSTTNANAAAIFNPVPSIATLLVSIMIIQSPASAILAHHGDPPTRFYPEASLFPLQLAIPPLDQPPRL